MNKQSHQKPKAIIFDCWNTLFYVDSNPTLWSKITRRFLHHRFNYRMMKTIERELMRKRNDDLKPAIRRIMIRSGIVPLPPLVGRVEQALEKSLDHQRVFPESLKVLEELGQEYKICLVTNTYYQSLNNLDKKFKLHKYFDVIVPSYEVGVIKPNPLIFEYALHKLGVKPQEAVMVGDNLRDDVQAAEAIGMRAVLVDRRDYHPYEDRRVHSLKELSKIL